MMSLYSIGDEGKSKPVIDYDKRTFAGNSGACEFVPAEGAAAALAGNYL